MMLIRRAIARFGNTVSDWVRALGLKSPRELTRPARRRFAARRREFKANFKARLAQRRADAPRRRAGRRRLKSSSLFVGVTGSSAKSTTTSLLAHILAGYGNTRHQVVWNTKRWLIKTLLAHPKNADFLVAEVAVTKPGDMRPMAELLRPDIAIVTMIDLEHYTAFRKREAIAEDKGHLVEMIRPGGFAVLNADDDHVMGMAARTSQRIVTFGRQRHADYRASGIQSGFPDRLRLVLDWKGGRLELQSNFLGDYFWVSVAAAAATALEIGVPPETIARQVAGYEPMANRCSIIDVPDGPTFILDTVKAPWHSLMLVFDLMARARAKAGRKRIVLGQISDYAGSNAKYGKAYRAGREISDQMVFIGKNAHRSKASEADRASGRFLPFDTPLEAAEYIRATAVPDELILLKGSPNLHLERIALSFLEEVKCWEPACGLMIGCHNCGLYRVPFEVHGGREEWRNPKPPKRRLFGLLKRRASETRGDH
jgi:UDP-N-acetylmuramoyl-tripeptide--D-alanyl-D-alanine ligase